ncbi:MAG: TonB-dependent receptor, partial [Tannerellaceae bacterium]|nr:TonB-dependent receptor [Tannerellaceae bacterium]
VKKSDLTGAVSSVSSKDLQADIARNAASALQGRVAGVSVSSMAGQPGSGMSINIRGLSSLSKNDPLYVIDGVYGDINMLDPADIASMEILKDASAAAIYGSRAANGVVLISTKSGRKESPTKVNVNVYAGVQNVVKKLDVMDAQQWLGFMKQNNVGLSDEIYSYQGKGTNWQDEAFRTAAIVKANVGISGGNKTSTYNISASYTKQDGTLKTTGYDAFNVRAKNSFSFFNDHVRAGSTIILKTWNQDYNDLTITDLHRQNPLVPVYDDSRVGGYGGTIGTMKNMDNPIGHLNLFDFERHGTDLLINACVEVDLGLKGLKYKFNTGINKNNLRKYQFEGKYDFGHNVSSTNRLSENANWDDQWMIENTLNYDNVFGKHTVSGLLGYSAQKYTERKIGAGRDNLYDNSFVINAGASDQQFTSGEANENALVSLFARVMYSYDSRYMLSASVRRDGSSRFADGHRYGVFPSVSVGWNVMNEEFFESAKTVMNELKIRGSWGKLGNQEIGNYKTQRTLVSGINGVQGNSWWMGAITGTEWVSPQDLTWEETSTYNIGLDMSFLNGRLNFTADAYTQETKNILLGISMPMSAGKTGSPTMNAGTITNKGLELALTHRNTVGEVYYHVGANVSTVKNKVKEITVGNGLEFGGFNPHAEGTITWAKVGKPIGSFYLLKTDGLFQSDAEVDAYVNSRGEKIQPNAQAGDIKYIDYNGDGVIDDNDKQYCGSPFPDFSFGIRGGAEWKRFDINLFFDGMVGNKIYNYTRARIESMNEITNYATSVLNAWTPTNTNTDIPRFTQSDANLNSKRNTDRWLENGSYLRLKTLEFGYTLPKQTSGKIMIDNLRIYTAMENLFTITKYKGYSPDLGQNDYDIQDGGGEGPMTRGTDYGRYPSA